MKKLILLSLILSFFSCKEKNLDYDLQKIEVFAVSFGINFPVNVGDSAVNAAKPYLIEDEKVLNQIEAFIPMLKKVKSSYTSDELYLRCKFKCTNNKSYILDYNKSQIKLDGVWYEDHPEMIQLILMSEKK